MKMTTFRINLEHDINKRNKIEIEMQTVGQHNEKGNAGDELGFATNWKRAFKKVHTNIKWLNAFAIINEIAAHKILKKFMKEHFKVKDNIIDKIIMKMLDEFQFVKRANIQPVSKDIKTVYAKLFHKDNIKAATKALEGETGGIDKFDLGILAFFSGGVIVLLVFLFLFCIYQNDGKFDEHVLSHIDALNPTMRITFLICYIILASGFVVRVFRKAQVNYLHIFEFDYRFKVQDLELAKAGIMLLFVWVFAYTLNIIEIVMEQDH